MTPVERQFIRQQSECLLNSEDIKFEVIGLKRMQSTGLYHSIEKPAPPQQNVLDQISEQRDKVIKADFITIFAIQCMINYVFITICSY